MIRLEVEDYCQQCMYFSPEIEDPVDPYDYYVRDIVVKCEHSDKCYTVERYYEAKITKANRERG